MRLFLRWFSIFLIAVSVEAAPYVWVTGECVKYRQTSRVPFSLNTIPASHLDSNEVWNRPASRITVAGARNEYVAFQVHVEATGTALTGVNVSLPFLTGSSASITSIDLYKAWYTQVTVPTTSPGPTMGMGWYPDALVPFSTPTYGAPFDIVAGKNQMVLVDVYIPKTAAPGSYAGVLTITAQGQQTITIPVELTVWGFTLTDSLFQKGRINITTYDKGGMGTVIPGNAINSGFGGTYDVWSDEFIALEKKFYQMARKHRFQLHPRAYQLPITGTGSSLVVDWTNFDRRWGHLLDGTAFDDGIPLMYFEPTMGSLAIDTLANGGKGSATHKLAIQRLANLYREHFTQKGWPAQLVCFEVDEPSGTEAFNYAKFFAQTMKESGANFKFRMDFYKNFSQELMDEFIGLADIWSIQGAFFNHNVVSTRIGIDQVWFYQGSAPSIGSEALDNSGLDLRTWPWILRRYNLDVADLWEGCKWQNTTNIWTQPANMSWPTNGEGVLFYPGIHVGLVEPISSLRMKEMRRGQSDREYMRILDDAGHSDFVDWKVRAIVPTALDEASRLNAMGDWSHDPIAWDKARRQFASAILDPSQASIREEIRRQGANATLSAVPNLLSSGTRFTYHVAIGGETRVTLYTRMGQRVRTLASGRRASGAYQVNWDGRDESGKAVASGVYLCVLENEGIRKANRFFHVQ